MWIIVLSGEMEFEAGGGERQRIVPASALLLETLLARGIAAVCSARVPQFLP
ncbi:hypothetical protein [Polaromonas jejuensis]|uniref:hypothetical protein n=1 Tax=Polaromonas jejuensis TaxID=457502 RepID=UPI000AA3F2FF|nr:hypothetical protein [Polaromonas jejuensis]